MITKLGILNFQSIEQLAVECGPITVFVGESDSGKSAVVRALYAAAFNDYPSDHVRTGSSHSTVVVATEAGSVMAEKGAKVNRYQVSLRKMTHQDPEQKRFDRAGRDVPEAVAEFLQWRSVELDDGTKFAPSISRQFDGPFLVGESPLKVAKILGSLTNISVLFAAIREGTLQERRAKQTAEQALTEAQAHEARADELLPAYEAAEDRHRRAYLAFVDTEALVEDLRVVEAAGVAIESAQNAFTGALAALAEALAVQVAVPDLDGTFTELAMVETLEAELIRLDDVLDETSAAWILEQTLASTHQRALDDFVALMKFCPLCEREWH